jgi:hypothetical protein
MQVFGGIVPLLMWLNQLTLAVNIIEKHVMAPSLCIKMCSLVSCSAYRFGAVPIGCVHDLCAYFCVWWWQSAELARAMSDISALTASATASIAKLQVTASVDTS